jgi:hypothetical protein
MRGKYITKQIELACLSNRRSRRKNIHTVLAKTIAERQAILKLWEESFFGTRTKTIHELLAETIAERKQLLQQWEHLFVPEPNNSYLMEDKKAA